MRLALTPHPDSPCDAVSAITVEVVRSAGGRLTLDFTVAGRIGDLALAPPAAAERTDDLWRHTCFEAFVRPQAGAAYCEFNLAPSTQWAAYGFTCRREGMAPLPQPTPPAIDIRAAETVLAVRAVLELGDVALLPGDGPWRAGVSAVIEETSGRRSYWALAHAPGKPDFHHPDTFVLDLPPPELR